jgi:Response regulator receiver domain
VAKIIIIDDEPAILRTSSRALRRDGHIVITFENGRTGIDYLQQETADLLITDIFMPELDGLETVTGADALNSGMPILAVCKPFRPAELRDLVTRLLTSAQRLAFLSDNLFLNRVILRRRRMRDSTTWFAVVMHRPSVRSHFSERYTS